MFRSRFHLRRANAAAATKCCGSISAGRSLERATTIVFSNRMYQILRGEFDGVPANPERGR
jgi:hypothetical protein